MNTVGRKLTLALVLSLCALAFGCGKDETTGPTQKPSTPFTWKITTLSNGTVKALAVNNAGTVFASIDGDGVYRSMDNGDTWTKTLNGQFQRNDGGAGYADCLCVEGNALYAGTDGGSVFISTDDTSSWVELGAGQMLGHVYALCVVNGTLYCGTEMGLFWLDGQNGWTKIDPMCTYSLSTLGTNGYLFAGGKYGYGAAMIYCSAPPLGNYDQPWFRIQVPGAWVKTMAGSPLGAYAGTPDGVIRACGSPSAWELIPSPQSVEAIAITPANHIFIGTANGIVERSTNGGNSWESASNGLSGYDAVYELAVNPVGYVYAGTTAGVYRGSF